MKDRLRQAMRLYAVTDRSWLGDSTLCEQAEQSLKGGVTFLQLREKHLSRYDFMEEARQLKKICESYRVPFVINDDVVIAREVDADGVHIGQSDMELIEARKVLGEDKIIGVSTKTLEQAVEAEKNGADYLGVGAVFTTDTKKDANAIAIETLKDICETVSIPVVAIGGICKENLMELAGNGIDGIAVVSAIYASTDIEAASKELYEKVGNMLEASTASGLEDPGI